MTHLIGRRPPAPALQDTLVAAKLHRGIDSMHGEMALALGYVQLVRIAAMAR